MSRWFWTTSAAVFALFFVWRFASTGAAHDLVSASGFALVCPHLWVRPLNLFSPLRAELAANASRPAPPVGVMAAGVVGFALILFGAAWRWLAA
jgi:hypothetical protein